MLVGCNRLIIYRVALLNFIPTGEWTRRHKCIFIRHDWNARTVVSSRENMWCDQAKSGGSWKYWFSDTPVEPNKAENVSYSYFGHPSTVHIFGTNWPISMFFLQNVAVKVVHTFSWKYENCIWLTSDWFWLMQRLPSHVYDILCTSYSIFTIVIHWTVTKSGENQLNHPTRFSQSQRKLCSETYAHMGLRNLCNNCAFTLCSRNVKKLMHLCTILMLVKYTRPCMPWALTLQNLSMRAFFFFHISLPKSKYTVIKL